MDARQRSIEIEVGYTLTAREWVWATARLRPATLVYDTIAAVALLVVGVWESDAAYLVVFWALSLIALTAYVWAPWLAGLASGALRRATTVTDLRVDTAGLTFRTPAGSSLTEWSAVKKVQEVGACLAVVRHSGRWQIVPKRAFSADQLDDLRAYLKADGLLDDRSLLSKIRRFANEGPEE
jgi:hypothetical protein